MDYLVDYRVRRYLRERPTPPSFAELSQALTVTDTELVEALERLVEAGHIARQTRPVEVAASPAPVTV